MMRILVVQTTDWIRRNPAQQHHLMELLSQRGHNIRVIDFELLWRERRDGLLSKRRILENVHKIHKNAKVTVIRPSFIRLPLLDYVSIIFSHFKEINRQIAEFRPHVIVSFGIAGYLAGKIARKNKIPFIYYWIDVTHLLIPVKLLQLIGWLMERRALKVADKILVINKKLGEYVIRNGADPNKVIVLGAGIYIDKFDPKHDGSNIRKRYGIGEKDLVLFFMGWLYKFSGLKEVTYHLLKTEEYKSIRLLIVGDGDIYNELCTMKNKLDKNNRVILAGRKNYNEIPSYIAAADICILPSHPYEKTVQNIVPIKIYEYMAMAKPITATKLPGIIMEFGDSCGIIYVEKPEDILLEAVKLAQDYKLSELGWKAREFVEKYDWNRIVSKFEKSLKEFIKT